MRLVISSANPILARMLYLEAKRLLLPDETAQVTLFLWDLDTPDPTVTPPMGAICVGFSAHTDAVGGAVREGLSALLSLPFSAREFDSTVAALLPREGRGLRIAADGTVLLNGKAVRLSRTEAALFSLLYRNRHRVVTGAEIDALLGESATKANAAAVYLYRVRRKLCADGKERIRTVRGKGARWVGEEALTV